MKFVTERRVGSGFMYQQEVVIIVSLQKKEPYALLQGSSFGIIFQKFNHFSTWKIQFMRYHDVSLIVLCFFFTSKQLSSVVKYLTKCFYTFFYFILLLVKIHEDKVPKVLVCVVGSHSGIFSKISHIFRLGIYAPANKTDKYLQDAS